MSDLEQRCSLTDANCAWPGECHVCEIAKKLLEMQDGINRMLAAVERAQKWATFTPPKDGTCPDAPTEETE